MTTIDTRLIINLLVLLVGAGPVGYAIGYHHGKSSNLNAYWDGYEMGTRDQQTHDWVDEATGKVQE